MAASRRQDRAGIVERYGCGGHADGRLRDGGGYGWRRLGSSAVCLGRTESQGHQFFVGAGSGTTEPAASVGRGDRRTDQPQTRYVRSAAIRSRGLGRQFLRCLRRDRGGRKGAAELGRRTLAQRDQPRAIGARRDLPQPRRCTAHSSRGCRGPGFRDLDSRRTDHAGPGLHRPAISVRAERTGTADAAGSRREGIVQRYSHGEDRDRRDRLGRRHGRRWPRSSADGVGRVESGGYFFAGADALCPGSEQAVIRRDRGAGQQHPRRLGLATLYRIGSRRQLLRCLARDSHRWAGTVHGDPRASKC